MRRVCVCVCVRALERDKEDLELLHAQYGYIGSRNGAAK